MSFSPTLCPSPLCPFHQKKEGARFIKKGFFRIKRLNQKVRKYQCTCCRKIFSSRTQKPDYRHKKKDLNFKLARLLSEGVSIRASARILGMTYKNTYRKYLWLKVMVDLHKPKLQHSSKRLQFDELESIHHTKCKPLSIALVVDENYRLLSAKVAIMPAQGKLALLSRKKYGVRVDERKEKLREAFCEVREKLTHVPEIIESDQKPSYRRIVKEMFPQTPYKQHQRQKKERLQARLHETKQKKRYDPLFIVNQRCAWMRSQVKRLARRSWCTTKKVENLQLHLDLLILMQFVERF